METLEDHLEANFDSTADEMNFDPASYNPPVEMVATFVAESSIVRAIVMGSGGPDNSEITESGLRFVRHLMATSRSMRFGFMPNFKSMDSIRELARDFIRRSGGASLALQSMHALTACD